MITWKVKRLQILRQTFGRSLKLTSAYVTLDAAPDVTEITVASHAFVTRLSSAVGVTEAAPVTTRALVVARFAGAVRAYVITVSGVRRRVVVHCKVRYAIKGKPNQLQQYDAHLHIPHRFTHSPIQYTCNHVII